MTLANPFGSRLNPQDNSRERAFVLWFEDVGITDIPLVGGKNASLGEMLRQLSSKGVNVPTGFATTAHAFRYFIRRAGLDKQLRALFADLDVNDIDNLQDKGRQARALIAHTPFPKELEDAIANAYIALCQRYGVQHDVSTTPDPDRQADYRYYHSGVDVAVRSSATAEDLPDASFAGQQETYLNISGVQAVLESCHRCFASLFTDRAISYRVIKNFDHFDVALSVGVQKMVRSDKATAGVMFSIDTETGFKNAVLITAAYGLGETVVQGAVTPDEYYVFKPTLKAGFRPILEKRLGSKDKKMVYDEDGGTLTKTVPVSDADRQRYALSPDEILKLANWACIIEDHYSSVHGDFTPMDIEWAKDGDTQQLFVVQARPETVQSHRTEHVLRTYRLQGKLPHPLMVGRAVGDLIGQGKARILTDVHHLAEFQAGEVLVADRTDPDWEPIMKKASALVTKQGGRTCHAAIIARELGIPAVVGCGDAVDQLQNGQEITVSCAEGDEGKIYPGLVQFEIDEVPLDDLPRTRTKILMNVGNPQEAFSLSAIPCDGVGLARSEFIIANHIKVHPLALIHFDQLRDPAVKQQVEQLTALYADHKPDFFIDKLAQGVGTLAAAFYPNPVIVRMSDFKSNEYANLLGGKQFEPDEENPMLGWRGASRYYDPRFAEAYGLECQAIKRVRDEMGLTNLIPMIPFCRTPDEGRRVLAEMAKHGLVRGENGLQVYVMCELPSNVILAKEFGEIFDGFSIGSNDLTQLTLGVDRDSSLVAHVFDERSEAVKTMVRVVIEKAKASHRKVGICGQAPSDYPDFATFLVEQGIDTISLNPDSVLKTLLAIAKTEQAIAAKVG